MKLLWLGISIASTQVSPQLCEGSTGPHEIPGRRPEARTSRFEPVPAGPLLFPRYLPQALYIFRSDPSPSSRRCWFERIEQYQALIVHDGSVYSSVSRAYISVVRVGGEP